LIKSRVFLPASCPFWLNQWSLLLLNTEFSVGKEANKKRATCYRVNKAFSALACDMKLIYSHRHELLNSLRCVAGRAMRVVLESNAVNVLAMYKGFEVSYTMTTRLPSHRCKYILTTMVVGRILSRGCNSGFFEG